MENHLEHTAIRRVMVGTDRSETADQAVHWAAGFANRYGAELFVVQVVVPQYPSATEFSRTSTHCCRQQ
jgi:nucleotide-binding universal stress UspA family protein